MDLNVSLPYPISEEARRIADELDISLDELFAAALSAYFTAQRGERLAQALDRFYDGIDSCMDPVLLNIQSASLGNDPW